MKDQAHEGQTIDRKSLRTVTGKTANFYALAQDCVCFANGSGGQILIGIEDQDETPPAGQRIEPALVDRLHKRIGELTVNVPFRPEIQRTENGGEIIVLNVFPSVGVASTCDGRYFLRMGDTCKPIVGDDILRLVSERSTIPWESMTSVRVERQTIDAQKLSKFVVEIRNSDRVKRSVKEKSSDELLEHYGLVSGEILTNIGLLLLGKAADRSKLGTAPVVQVIRYDDLGTKTGKFVWNDHSLSPIELIEAIWKEVPDFRESYEIPDGLFRTSIPAFDEVVVRELLVNALVHRPYTQRGDIFLNLHPDRLEVVNPGRLPLGVTPDNILHTTRRRNDGLVRVFHDLRLMENEGSGFDMMYERLLSSGKAAPTVTEGVDSVHVVVPRRIIQPEVIRMLNEAEHKYHLSQRERISLGLLAQSEGLSTATLSQHLGLKDTEALRPWIERLMNFGLISQSGRARSRHYFVPSILLREAGHDGQINSSHTQQLSLRALILKDLESFPDSSISEVHSRIGPEIGLKTLQREITKLVEEGCLTAIGLRRWRRYNTANSITHKKQFVL